MELRARMKERGWPGKAMQAREGFLCFCSESSIKAERLFCFALLCFQKFPCASLVLNETKLCG